MKSSLKKIVVGIIGSIVLIAGIAMIALPGPAFIVIPAGLAILASEFEWAQRWLKNAREWVHSKMKRKNKSPISDRLQNQ